MSMLQTYASVVFSVVVFILMRFRPSTLIRYVCVFVLIHFQERLQIDEFSMQTLSVLVWTEGLNASKCQRGRDLTLRSLIYCNDYVNPITQKHLLVIR